MRKSKWQHRHHEGHMKVIFVSYNVKVQFYRGAFAYNPFHNLQTAWISVKECMVERNDYG